MGSRRHVCPQSLHCTLMGASLECDRINCLPAASTAAGDPILGVNLWLSAVKAEYIVPFLSPLEVPAVGWCQGVLGIRLGLDVLLSLLFGPTVNDPGFADTMFVLLVVDIYDPIAASGGSKPCLELAQPRADATHRVGDNAEGGGRKQRWPNCRLVLPPKMDQRGGVG